MKQTSKPIKVKFYTKDGAKLFKKRKRFAKPILVKFYTEENRAVFFKGIKT